MLSKSNAIPTIKRNTLEKKNQNPNRSGNCSNQWIPVSYNNRHRSRLNEGSIQLDIQTHNSYSSIQVNNDNDSFGNDTNINKNSKNNKGNKLGLPSKLNETFSQQSK